MKRREFLTVGTMGLMTLMVSVYGLSKVFGESNGAGQGAQSSKSSAGGDNMKLLVITSSPHPKNESTDS